MYRTFALAAAIAALSVPAFAADVTISLTGKSQAQILTEIHNAAQSVCVKDGYTRMDQEIACTAEVEQQALDELAAKQPKKS